MGHWNEMNIPNLAGKLVVVTGANSGLGLHTSRALAQHGAKVIMACRNTEKAKRAVETIKGQAPAAQLEVRALDLASLASIQAFTEGLARDQVRIDILINNAGVMAVPKGQTADGFETQMGTNHLGHFALTGRLLDLMQPGGRIVCVSSVVHRRTKGIDLDDLNWDKRPYRTWDAYSDSKLANLVFMFELNRRIRQAGKDIIVVGAHPGYSDTNLQYVASEVKQSRLEEAFWCVSNALFAQPAERGALPSLYAATAEGVNSGDYIGPDGFQELRGYPTKVGCRKLARDEQLATQLWALSESMTGVAYLSH